MPPLIYDTDLSPYLVHLTRSRSGRTAKENLHSIIQGKALLPGVYFGEDYSESDAKYADLPRKLTPEEEREFFGSISFTETPLRYIRRLFDIKGREKDLTHYGLVFPKEFLIRQGASPVFYINNARGDRKELVGALASLIETHPKEAAQILPLIAVFGKKLKQPIDYKGFVWEREWRLPIAESMLLQFNEDDVFAGLCPENEIKEFETAFPPIRFIDPRKFNDHWFKLEPRRRKMERRSP